MNSHVDYLSAKWKHYKMNGLTDDQMFFLINMISVRTKIDFLELLIYIENN